MLSSKNVDQLLLAGVSVLPLDSRTAELNIDGVPWVAHVIAQEHAPSTEQLEAASSLPEGEVSLFVVPRASRRSIELMRRHPRAWLATEEGTYLLGALAVQPETPSPFPRGRVPWGRYALMRVLLRTSALRTQAELAEEAGITQGTASPALAKIAGLERVPNKGWRAADPEALWKQFMEGYPGPRGVRTYWYYRGPFMKLTEQLAGYAVLSADGAADMIAPWRVPVRTVAYSRAMVHMESLGFTPALKSESNLELVIPEDTTIFATAQAWGSEVADPAIAAWDVLQVGGNDAGEAAEAIRSTVMQRMRN